MTTGIAEFFLASYSKQGFFSLFDAERDEGRSFILKGGPGCGKSTCLEKISKNAPQGSERILCALAPDSLDGLILPGGDIVLDGTAPHAAELAFPGADGDYLNLPPLLDIAGLQSKRGELHRLSGLADAHMNGALRLIEASHLAEQHIRGLLLPLLPEAKLRRRADGIIARELPLRGKRGRIRRRFLSAVAAGGEITLWGTVKAMADRVYLLEDSFGFADIMLRPIMCAAIDRGWEVYACLNPKDPGRLGHLLIPALRLAFVSGTKPPDCKIYRRIRIDAYLDAAGLKAVRGKVKLMGKVNAALMEEAAAELVNAKKGHDDVEALYRPHVDFSLVRQAADRMIKTVLNGG